VNKKIIITYIYLYCSSSSKSKVGPKPSKNQNKLELPSDWHATKSFNALATSHVTINVHDN
jgi:hypothetical protein